MDWTGQKLAESLCIYLTLGFGLIAFVVGYARQDFGLMMKVRELMVFSIAIDFVCLSAFIDALPQGALCCCFAGYSHANGSDIRLLS